MIFGILSGMQYKITYLTRDFDCKHATLNKTARLFDAKRAHDLGKPVPSLGTHNAGSSYTLFVA